MLPLSNLFGSYSNEKGLKYHLGLSLNCFLLSIALWKAPSRAEEGKEQGYLYAEREVKLFEQHSNTNIL